MFPTCDTCLLIFHFLTLSRSCSGQSFPHVSQFATVATLSTERCRHGVLRGCHCHGSWSVSQNNCVAFVLAVLMVWHVAGCSHAFATLAARDHVDLHVSCRHLLPKAWATPPAFYVLSLTQNSQTHSTTARVDARADEGAETPIIISHLFVLCPRDEQRPQRAVSLRTSCSG